ncbi:MAG: hypothetical protein JW841_14725 [Deltaproteobacteria bacterium]|nr:hypothetical protein [Deltaproteobacteria bacterium]
MFNLLINKRRHWFLSASAVIFLGTLVMANTLPPFKEFIELRAPPATLVEIKNQDYTNDCQALEKNILTYLRQNFCIVAKRYFIIDPRADWISLEKFVASELRQKNYKREKYAWHRPGYDRIAVWRHDSKNSYITVALTNTAEEKKVIAGYFALEHK